MHRCECEINESRQFIENIFDICYSLLQGLPAC